MKESVLLAAAMQGSATIPMQAMPDVSFSATAFRQASIFWASAGLGAADAPVTSHGNGQQNGGRPLMKSNR